MQDLRREELLLEKRRKAAEREYEKKLADLKKDEKFADAYLRVSYLKFELAKRRVFGMEIDENSEKEFVDLSRFVSEKLQSAGINSDDTPSYSCKKCSDTGFADGTQCECLERARIEINLGDYRNLQSTPTADNIDFKFYGAEEENYRKRAQFIKKNFMDGSLNYCTVLGAPGTGKTFLANSFMKQALLSGKSIKIINSVRLNREFLEYHCAPLEQKNDLWEEICGYDFLLIDDLGVESQIKNVTAQYLYELLTERADKKTIITSNISINQLEDLYGQRIFSRLSDKLRGAVFTVTGSDYRIK